MDSMNLSSRKVSKGTRPKQLEKVQVREYEMKKKDVPLCFEDLVRAAVCEIDVPFIQPTFCSPDKFVSFSTEGENPIIITTTIHTLPKCDHYTLLPYKGIPVKEPGILTRVYSDQQLVNKVLAEVNERVGTTMNEYSRRYYSTPKFEKIQALSVIFMVQTTIALNDEYLSTLRREKEIILTFSTPYLFKERMLKRTIIVIEEMLCVLRIAYDCKEGKMHVSANCVHKLFEGSNPFMHSNQIPQTELPFPYFDVIPRSMSLPIAEQLSYPPSFLREHIKPFAIQYYDYLERNLHDVESIIMNNTFNRSDRSTRGAIYAKFFRFLSYFIGAAITVSNLYSDMKTRRIYFKVPSKILFNETAPHIMMVGIGFTCFCTIEIRPCLREQYYEVYVSKLSTLKEYGLQY